jgi:hypothetical protein
MPRTNNSAKEKKLAPKANKDELGFDILKHQTTGV